MRRVVAMAALACAAAPAFAIDEGVAKGSLVVGDRTIALTHAYTHQHDNGEGLLDGPQLRILLADREIPHTLLGGINTARLDNLARKGDVQGVLLLADPREPAAGARGVLLTAGSDRGKPLAGFLVKGGDGGFRELLIGNNRVVGEVHHDATSNTPAFRYAATFSAPLFQEERITEKLAGSRARESAQFTVLAAYSKALGAGELDAARRLATPESFREVDALIAQVGRPTALKMFGKMSAMLGAKSEAQVFVRGQRALVVFQAGENRGVQSLVRAGGKWLVD